MNKAYLFTNEVHSRCMLWELADALVFAAALKPPIHVDKHKSTDPLLFVRFQARRAPGGLRAERTPPRSKAGIIQRVSNSRTLDSTRDDTELYP